MKLLLFFLLVNSVAHARLGETVEQCEARYGPSHGRDAVKGEIYFDKAGIRITVHFHSGRCDALTLCNVDDSEFTEAEVRVLAENNLGKGWKAAEPAEPEINRIAFYSLTQEQRGYLRTKTPDLIFFTADWFQRQHGPEAKKSDAGRRLNGF